MSSQEIGDLEVPWEPFLVLRDGSSHEIDSLSFVMEMAIVAMAKVWYGCLGASCPRWDDQALHAFAPP